MWIGPCLKVNLIFKKGLTKLIPCFYALSHVLWEYLRELKNNLLLPYFHLKLPVAWQNITMGNWILHIGVSLEQYFDQ